MKDPLYNESVSSIRQVSIYSEDSNLFVHLHSLIKVCQASG